MIATYADEGWKTQFWYRTHVLAEIKSNQDLDWYYRIHMALKAKYPFTQEFKSDSARETLSKIDHITKKRIWDTLQDVLIVLVDPKKYIKSLGIEIGGKNSFIFRNEGREFILRSDEVELYPQIDKILKKYVSELVIDDSPLNNVKMHVAELPVLVHNEEFFSPDRIIKLLNEKGDNKMVVGAVKLTARLFVAFYEVIDPYTRREIISEINEYGESLLFPLYPEKILKETISIDRFFDEGDSASTDIIKKYVREIESRLSYLNDKEYVPHSEVKDIPSIGSVYIQAADWAQGIARAIYEKEGISGLKRYFKYVIFNGDILFD